MQRVQMICHSENGFALLRSPAERGRDVIIDYVGDLAHDFERRGMHGVATFSVSLPMLRSRGSSLRTRLPRGDPLGPRVYLPIACSSSSFIAGFGRYCRFFRSSGQRRWCAGIGLGFAVTDDANLGMGEGVRRFACADRANER
jgi:hypothetical protein